MWTDADFEDLDATGAKLRKSVAGATGLKPWLKALDALDDEKHAELMRVGLEKSFRVWSKRAPKPLSTLLLSWVEMSEAGGVPTQVWGTGYHGRGEKRQASFRESEGFELGAYAELLEKTADLEVPKVRVFHKLVVLETLRLARRAFAAAATGKAFAALRKAEEFEVVASPGHDEPRCRIWGEAPQQAIAPIEAARPTAKELDDLLEEVMDLVHRDRWAIEHKESRRSVAFKRALEPLYDELRGYERQARTGKLPKSAGKRLVDAVEKDVFQEHPEFQAGLGRILNALGR